MPVYAYSATDRAQRPVSGTMIADTPASGRDCLRDRGLSIETFRVATVTHRGFLSRSQGRGQGRGCDRNRVFGGSRRNAQVAELARFLSLLLRAEIPLAECLDVLGGQCDPKLSVVLADIRDRVTGGDSLGEALAAHGGWFDPVFVSAAKMGELSGQLDTALADLATHLHARQALRHKLSGALTYPIILVFVGVGVVLFLMSYVVPQLLTVLATAGRPLPASTALLKSTSDLLVAHWLLLAIAVATCLGGMVVYYGRPSGRLRIQRTLLRIPALGPLLQKTIVAQFAQQMALLLRTGIPFVDAVRNVSGQSRNLVLAAELSAAAEAVESGSDIAPTLAGSRIFPPVVRHLIAVGQNSGELTGMLDQLRERYVVEVNFAVTKFATALEPLLIVLLAAMVGFVAFACLMPILEATRGIQ